MTASTLLGHCWRHGPPGYDIPASVDRLHTHLIGCSQLRWDSTSRASAGTSMRASRTTAWPCIGASPATSASQRTWPRPPCPHLFDLPCLLVVECSRDDCVSFALSGQVQFDMQCMSSIANQIGLYLEATVRGRRESKTQALNKLSCATSYVRGSSWHALCSVLPNCRDGVGVPAGCLQPVRRQCVRAALARLRRVEQWVEPMRLGGGGQARCRTRRRGGSVARADREEQRGD